MRILQISIEIHRILFLHPMEGGQTGVKRPHFVGLASNL